MERGREGGRNITYRFIRSILLLSHCLCAPRKLVLDTRAGAAGEREGQGGCCVEAELGRLLRAGHVLLLQRLLPGEFGESEIACGEAIDESELWRDDSCQFMTIGLCWVGRKETCLLDCHFLETFALRHTRDVDVLHVDFGRSGCGELEGDFVL